MARVRDVVAAIDRAAPLRLQLDWDNSGLLVGDPEATVRRVMVALDATGEVIGEARRRRAECLVVHHPIFFSKLKSLSPETPAGATALRAAAARIALVAAHTNYDAAPEGLNHLLARRLGLVDAEPMEGSAPGRGCKLVAFVPEGDLARVQRAIFAAGAGRIGEYGECSFRVSGTGTFFGGESARPAVGRRGRREEVSELRLETVVPPGRVEAVVRALRGAHSYEEPAFDVYPLEVPAEGAGIGRVGRLRRPEPLAAFVARVKRAFGVRTVEVVGSLRRRVSRVAVSSGGAGDRWPKAAEAGADVFVTGEMRHHDRLAARESGMVTIVAGHYATEHPAVEGFARILTAALPGLAVMTSRAETNPTAWR